MISGSTRPAARQLETLFRLGTLGGLSDAHLLERFLVHRGEDAEAAFAAVVERHGPMVLRVCRRILADPNDAEDAFQVTFLVLARKACSIARRALLANWLYGVAVRSAREVRKNAARRRAREEPMHNMQPAQSRPAEESGELRCQIDEELSRLPDSFRAPVVLCDLEGMTHKEAAAILGVPVGTVSSRLVRARDLLRPRLARRGLDPSDADPPRDSTPMAVPPALIAATSRAAVRLATGAPFARAAIRRLERPPRRQQGDGETVGRLRRDHLAMLVGEPREAAEPRPVARGLHPVGVCHRCQRDHLGQGVEGQGRRRGGRRTDGDDESSGGRRAETAPLTRRRLSESVP
jgi:RNA polymerase sigma factor (sigma-70 family)